MNKTQKLNMVLLVGLLFTGCGTEKSKESKVVLEGTTTTSVSTLDKSTNTASVHVVSDINKAKHVFNDNEIAVLTSGTPQDGYITVKSGKHFIKVCEDDEGNRCGKEDKVLVSTNLDSSVYKAIELEGKTGGMTTNNDNIVYGTRVGKVYSLDLESETSTYLFDINNRVGGMAHIKDDSYYISSTDTGRIYKMDTSEETIQTIASLPFPDGLDFYNSKIYSVANDVSGVLTVFDNSEKKIGTLSTGISDVTGITHTDNFLYILSEDGNIYQVNSETGKSAQIFSNDNLFTKGNSFNGLEAITILNNKIYVSYIDDENLYEINLDLNDFE